MAQVPQFINYQGRVAVGGAHFDGAGYFKFALVNGTAPALHLLEQRRHRHGGRQTGDGRFSNSKQGALLRPAGRRDDSGHDGHPRHGVCQQR